MPGSFRPKTGVIKPPASRGSGQLAVNNGTTRDGLVILTRDDSPVTAGYVRTGEVLKLTGIRDGTYRIYFSTGKEWDGERFTSAPRFQRFNDPLEFASSNHSYAVWSVTLHGVTQGKASASSVDSAHFPRIGD